MMTEQDQLESRIAEAQEQFMEELREKFAEGRNDRWNALIEDPDVINNWNPEEESWEEFLESDSISDMWKGSESEAWEEELISAQDEWKDVEADLRAD